jgi:hypothetical protein
MPGVESHAGEVGGCCVVGEFGCWTGAQRLFALLTVTAVLQRAAALLTM